MEIATVPRIPVNLSEGSDRVFGRNCSRYRPRRALRASFVCERFHFLEKFARRRVSAPLALMQSYERWEAVPQEPLRLLIREARKPTKVAPVGAGGITFEATG